MLCKTENTELNVHKHCLVHNKYIKSKKFLACLVYIKVMFHIQCLACHLALQVGSKANSFTVDL